MMDSCLGSSRVVSVCAWRSRAVVTCSCVAAGGVGVGVEDTGVGVGGEDIGVDGVDGLLALLALGCSGALETGVDGS